MKKRKRMYDSKSEELKRQLNWELENQHLPRLKRQLQDELRLFEARERARKDEVRRLETRVERLEKLNKDLAHEVNVLASELEQVQPELAKLAKKVKVWTD